MARRRSYSDDTLSLCVPGMELSYWDVDERGDAASPAVADAWWEYGLAACRLGDAYYVLPDHAPERHPDLYGHPCPVREMAELVRQGDVVSAAALHDWLVEHEIPVPPPVLALLAHPPGRTGMLRRRLEQEPELAQLSNREIARRCRVSEALVRRVRREMASAHPGAQIDTPRRVRRGQSEYTMRPRSSPSEE